MKTVRKPTRRKQKKLPAGKIAIGCGVGMLGLILFAGSGGNKKDAAVPTAAPAAIVTEYVTVGPVTQIPATVAPATVAPATVPPVTKAPTSAPATQAPTAAPTEIPTLKKGSKGEAVKALQQRLIEMNYLKGTADGDYGAKTVQAVKDFQLVNHLPIDGVAGPETIRLMFRYPTYNSVVYKSKNGKVYHSRRECSGMKNPTSMTLVEAMSQNLGPCSHCH